MSLRTAVATDPEADGFEAWVRAVESRDARFDGRVFVAVTSTGIYCRPVCAAPMPQRRHLRFFAEASSAEREGFHACRRCRPGPRRDPFEPETHAELVGRALELVTTVGGVAGLARGLGVEPGRLRRAFDAELGTTPSAVLRSVRAGGRLAIALSYRAPFDAPALLSFLGDRAIPGVEEVRGSAFSRSLSTERGLAAISLAIEDDRVLLDVAFDDVRSLRSVMRTARSLFDLDVDPTSVARTLGRDPSLRSLVLAHPGIRLPGAADGFELAVRAIVGQQVSVTAARTMLGRIAARFGTPLEGAILMLFPGAEALAEAPLEELGVIGRSASAIRRVGAMVAGGELDLSGSDDPDVTVDRLLELDGIGPWTAEYIRMRALRDPDAFVSSDLGVRHAFERLGLDATPHAIVARAEAWRPWRAYAAMLLWRLDA